MFKKPPVSTDSSSSQPDASDSDKSSNAPKKWIWGAVGIASLLALGFVMSWRTGAAQKKTPRKSDDKLPDRLPPYSLTKDWRLIESIDDALQSAHIDGVDVYVKHGKVLLVASASRQAELSEALKIISALTGVRTVEGTIRESDGGQVFSSASK
jgi:osmotically-inducible protein OsmY